MNTYENMNTYEKMKSEHFRLSAKITALENSIAALPEGSLEWRKQGSGYRYYQRLDDKKIYLAKKDPAFIKELAKKKYLQKMLQDTKQEKMRLENT